MVEERKGKVTQNTGVIIIRPAPMAEVEHVASRGFASGKEKPLTSRMPQGLEQIERLKPRSITYPKDPTTRMRVVKEIGEDVIERLSRRESNEEYLPVVTKAMGEVLRLDSSEEVRSAAVELLCDVLLHENTPRRNKFAIELVLVGHVKNENAPKVLYAIVKPLYERKETELDTLDANRIEKIFAAIEKRLPEFETGYQNIPDLIQVFGEYH